MMLVLLLTVFDFARGFHAYVSVVNGARDGARVAVQPDRECDTVDAKPAAENAASPYDVDVTVSWNGVLKLCTVTVAYDYTPVLPFVTAEFDLPGIGHVGPLWDGGVSSTARSVS